MVKNKDRNSQSDMRNVTLLAIALMVFSFGTLVAQTTTRREPPKGSLTSGTIDSQFIYIYAISKTQDGIEHVRQANLDLLRKNVADTIRMLNRQIVDLKAKDDGQQASVDAMADSLVQVRNDLQVTQREKDSFSFIGIPLQKGTYSLMMWGIVVLLALALVFYIYRHNQSQVVTTDTKKAIEELQADFDQHRKKSMEKEQKLMRQLQDEINKRLG